jgi:hypothetical protein
MRVGESHPGRRQAIQMRRLNLRVPVVAAEVAVPEIIGQDDDDIRSLRCGGVERANTNEQPRESERNDFHEAVTFQFSDAALKPTIGCAAQAFEATATKLNKIADCVSGDLTCR